MNTAKDFYLTNEWVALRARRLIVDGSRCRMCGGRPSEGFRLEVHHICPRASYPELELDFGNTVLLCRKCHCGLHWAQHRARNGLQAANDPYFELVPRKPTNPQQLSLFGGSEP